MRRLWTGALDSIDRMSDRELIAFILFSAAILGLAIVRAIS